MKVRELFEEIPGYTVLAANVELKDGHAVDIVRQVLRGANTVKIYAQIWKGVTQDRKASEKVIFTGRKEDVKMTELRVKAKQFLNDFVK